jgi:hypothetical protein
MALLDVCEVLDDPLFTSEVTLTKRTESSDDYGNPVWSDGDSATVQAVVTADQKSIERLPDDLQKSGTILVRVNSDCVPSGYGVANDCVTWRGKTFVIKDSSDYSHFGRGFMRFVCWPEDVTDVSY